MPQNDILGHPFIGPVMTPPAGRSPGRALLNYRTPRLCRPMSPGTFEERRR